MSAAYNNHKGKRHHSSRKDSKEALNEEVNVRDWCSFIDLEKVTELRKNTDPDHPKYPYITSVWKKLVSVSEGISLQLPHRYTAEELKKYHAQCASIVYALLNPEKPEEPQADPVQMQLFQPHMYPPQMQLFQPQMYFQ